MIDGEFEILIGYSSWSVETYNTNGKFLTQLKCKRNSLLSNYHSGIFCIDGKTYSLTNNPEGIRCSTDRGELCKVDIRTFNLFGRSALIQIGDNKYELKRENLKQQFLVKDLYHKGEFEIVGKVYRKKQRNIFGLIYFDDKLFNSVRLLNFSVDENLLQIILIMCGYCIRVFLEVDMGEYSGKVNR